MKLLTLRQLEELTGKNRKFLTEALQRTPFVPGANRAHLYESTKAMAVIYGAAVDYEEARRQQALASAQLARVRSETLRKERIPLVEVLSHWDQILQSVVRTLKASKDRVLTLELINEILDNFRSLPRHITDVHPDFHKIAQFIESLGHQTVTYDGDEPR